MLNFIPYYITYVVFAIQYLRFNISRAQAVDDSKIFIGLIFALTEYQNAKVVY